MDNSIILNMEETPVEQHIINNVTIKTPFIESNVPAWFSLIEAQFIINNYRQTNMKFYHTLNALPHHIVGNLPQTVLESCNYQTLKTEILMSFEKSKPEMLDKLMSKRTISGRPSIYLNELRALALKLGVDEDIVRHRFVQALPSSIAPVIAAQKDLELDRLGKITDDLIAQFPNYTQTHAHVQQVVTRPQQNKNKNKCDCPPGVRPFNSKQKPRVCRAHLYYGDSARYCKPWCKWPNKRNLQIQPSSRSNSRSNSPVPNFSEN